MDNYLKKGEQAARMTLWAWTTWSPSTARDTSKNSLFPLRSLKEPLMLDSKSFQRRQYLSDDPIVFLERRNNNGLGRRVSGLDYTRIRRLKIILK